MVVEGDSDEFVYQQPGAIPSLFWWGLTARPGGAPLLEADAQLKAHVEPIAQAVVQGDRLQVDRLRLALKTVFLVANLGLLGETIGPLLDAVDNVLDARKLNETASHLLRSRENLLQDALQRNSGTVFSTGPAALAIGRAEQDGQTLAQVATLLPMLIVVQDAQFLDPVTISLLRVLLHQAGATGMIVLLIDSDQTLNTPDPNAPLAG